MKPRKKKISKSERIPKLGSPARDIMLNNLTDMADYTNAMKRGLPFFTKVELENIEEKYKDGITWDEVESVLSAKGTLLKYATFRKYIQDAIIPKAKSHKSTESGRVAIYESNLIRHLNFVNFFYNVTDAPMIDELMKIIGNYEISYKDAIESFLESGNLYLELVHEMTKGYSDATDAIEKALANRDDKLKILKMFERIREKYEKYIEKDLSELLNLLESQKMLVTQIPDDDSLPTGEA